MKFKILDGKHEQAGKDGILRRYTKGMTVESEHDLARMFNRRQCIKFKKVDDEVPVDVPPPVGVFTPNDDDSDVPSDAEVINAELLEKETEEAEEVASQFEIEDVFSDMSIPQLRAYAKEEGIDLKGLNKKVDILRAIRQITAE